MIYCAVLRRAEERVSSVGAWRKVVASRPPLWKALSIAKSFNRFRLLNETYTRALIGAFGDLHKFLLYCKLIENLRWRRKFRVQHRSD